MEYKPQQLFLFIFIALIGFGAYILLSMALPLLNSNPFFAIATFGGLAVAIYFAVMYIKSMNTQAKAKLSGMMLMLILLVSGAGVFFTAYAFNVGGTQDVIDNIVTPPPASGTRLTIYYEDESIAPQVFDSKDYDDMGIPLAIYSPQSPNPNAPIASVKLEMYMTPTWTSTATLTGYTVTGTYNVYLYKIPPTTILKQFTMPMSPLHPTLTSGQSVVIASATMTNGDIEQLISTNGGVKSTSTVYELTYKLSDFKLAMDFSNGDHVEKTATAPDASFSCVWKDATGTSTITGLTVSFYKTYYQ